MYLIFKQMTYDFWSGNMESDGRVIRTDIGVDICDIDYRGSRVVTSINVM